VRTSAGQPLTKVLPVPYPRAVVITTQPYQVSQPPVLLNLGQFSCSSTGQFSSEPDSCRRGPALYRRHVLCYVGLCALLLVQRLGCCVYGGAESPLAVMTDADARGCSAEGLSVRPVLERHVLALKSRCLLVTPCGLVLDPICIAHLRKH
jgi:hypothetical protein